MSEIKHSETERADLNSSQSNDQELNETPIQIFNSWDELNVSTELLRGIYATGFEKPSDIQSKAINPIICGKDIIAQAQSGTGKTGSFTIGALSHVNVNDNSTQVLIMGPTHELAHQITSVITSLSSMMTGIRIKTIVGGSSIDGDVDDMRRNCPHVIVGCPGRVHDMIRRRYINARRIKLIILDEADEMLSVGFRDQIYNIFQHLDKNVQVALFSATLPNHIFQITNKFMRNPVKICVKSENLTLEGIKQYYVALHDDTDKIMTLKDLYKHITVAQCIIYANSVPRVTRLYEFMKEDGFPVGCIHGKMDKSEREKVFKDFKCGGLRVLISSDVTSRGIDIQQVSIVINFDLPSNIENYLHRIGRSGRWGRKGTSINFITRQDVSKMREIEAYYGTQIEELPATLSLN